MELSVATQLIEGGVKYSDTPQRWADLGAGAGLFTQALSWLLPSRSVIDAVDKSPAIKAGIPDTAPNITVHGIQQNFETLELPHSAYDGIVLANALHFVKEKNQFLKSLVPILSPRGVLIIVEYNLKVPNQWVPFPIDFSDLTQLAKANGLREIHKLGEANSRYHSAGMYSASLCL